MKRIFFCLLFLSLFSSLSALENSKTDSDVEIEANSRESQTVESTGISNTENERKLSPEKKKELQSVIKPSENIIYQGEMFIKFALGLTVPLFSHFFNNSSIGNKGYTNNSKLYGVPVGGSASIDFMYYLEHNLGVGVELGLLLLETQANYQSLVTVGARGQYMLRRWPFDIPFSVGLGIAFNSLYIEDIESLLYAGPYIKPDFGFFYNINDKWSVGFNTTFLVVSEFYFKEEKKNQSNFSTFWDITLSARYRF